jgi:hypothetical protein
MNTRHRPKESRPAKGFNGKPIATCGACGKQAYTTKATAKQAATRLHPGTRMRVYQCHDTNWWHLTSQDAATTAQHRDRAAGEYRTEKAK